MEPAVRGARAQPEIAEALVPKPKIWDPSTQSSNQSPIAPGTGISAAETSAQIAPLCFAEISVETGRASQSPHPSATTATIPARAPTQGLGGGRTRARTWDPMIKSHPLRLDISSEFSQLRQNPNIRDQWLTAKNPTMWARQCWRIDASEASGRSPVFLSEGVTREATL